MTDRITAHIQRLPEVEEAVAGFRDYIASQTLAREVILEDAVSGGVEVEWLEDNTITLKLEKI